jgi:hypothetical protein
MIPVLEVDLGNRTGDQREKSPVEIQLRYRGQSSGTITTRRPVLEVSVFGGELFAPETAFRLEARARTDRGEIVVGEAASCQFVDVATGILTVKTGCAVKVPLRIVEDFTGSMEVRAIDAETRVILGLFEVRAGLVSKNGDDGERSGPDAGRAILALPRSIERSRLPGQALRRA